MNADLSTDFLEKFVEEMSNLYYEAGEYAVFYYPKENRPGNFVRIKNDGTEVTLIENKVGELVRRTTSTIYPWMSVFSEEQHEETNPNARYAWCFDEIDGTDGYLHCNGQFALFGCLLDFKKESVIAAIMHKPIGTDPIKKISRKEFLTAINGKGTVLRSIYEDGREEKELLKVSDASELNQGRLVSSLKSMNDDLLYLLKHLPIQSYKPVGGATMKAAIIAQGSLESAMSLAGPFIGTVRLPNQSPIKPWDRGVELLVTEAGGKSTDFFGHENKYKRGVLGYNNGLIASNGKVHEELMKRSHEILKERIIFEERDMAL